MGEKGPYTKKVLELFKNPHNYGRIKNADGIGKVGNQVCGDVMWLYIKVGKRKSASVPLGLRLPAGKAGRGEEEFIKDVKFETFGCVAAISTSSIITDMVKGKTIKEALAIKKDDVVKLLGGLPKIKLHCSVLAVDALRAAIKDYFSKNKSIY